MLDGKTAVITGAASGIGRAIATEFAAHGADIVVADVTRDPRDGARPTDVRIAADTEVRSEFAETDVSDPEAVEALFEAVADTFGGTDVLVNNAASFRDGSVGDLSIDSWRRLIDVNLTGTFTCSKAALPQLLDAEGSIINISSVAGIQATSRKAGYCASKAGVTNLTRQMALDYAAEGLRVNSIHPGLIDTASSKDVQETSHGRRILDAHPGDRLGRPEEVAGAAVFLASELASYVNGHALVVDGALTTKYY
jgi:NAD(P)-dependent dehydrogenase (short-subunit alcohol dehydrogenase family)